jgi:membrane protein DedA with SNARE-associated domain
MGLQDLIAHFGYLAVLVGTFLEGETVLIIAGFAAHRGFLRLPLVIIFAFIGSAIGDQFYFYIGRRKGTAFINKHRKLIPKIERFRVLLNRYNILIIFAFRFIYGLRTVAPFAIGLSEISFIKFFIINMISGIVWAVLIGFLGYLFGQAVEILIDDIKKYEIYILSAGIAIVIIRFVFIWMKRKKNENSI